MWAVTDVTVMDIFWRVDIQSALWSVHIYIKHVACRRSHTFTYVQQLITGMCNVQYVRIFSGFCKHLPEIYTQIFFPTQNRNDHNMNLKADKSNTYHASKEDKAVY